MKTPIISVVVPIYKTPQEFLRPCIESILAQTVTDSQIILVDDGSPDECGSICDEYAAKDPRILVIHQENAGPSAARNNGVLHATGHYLTFTDADDLLELNAWELAITALESSRAQCAVFGRMTGGEEHWEPMPVSEQTKNLAVEEAMAMRRVAADTLGTRSGMRMPSVLRMEVRSLFSMNPCLPMRINIGFW